MKLSRGLSLVKPVETDETRTGGAIILVADTRERMTLGQCEVVAVGAPAECDPARSRAERKCERFHWMETSPERTNVRVHRCDVRVGDWLLVRPRAFVDGPHPERKEWFVRQDDVMAILGRAEPPLTRKEADSAAAADDATWD